MNHAPGPQAPRVLVVEDDDALRSAMESCLSRAGFAVFPAGTGADAVEAARVVHPHAAVIDLMLPDGGGLGVARELWRQHGLRAVPVLFTTALAPPAVKPLLAAAPVLFKPFSGRELVRWVQGATLGAWLDGASASP